MRGTMLSSFEILSHFICKQLFEGVTMTRKAFTCEVKNFQRLSSLPMISNQGMAELEFRSKETDSRAKYINWTFI